MDRSSLLQALERARANNGLDPLTGYFDVAIEAHLRNAVDDPFDVYRRSAGEVEARNVQSRMNMTPAERRATPPWLTQDVPDEMQIVRGAPRGTSQSMASLPMDDASRIVRSKGLGYSDEPFYRGEATGQLPDQYESGFFSRDKETAKGFAERGGQPEPREFRLNLQNTFSDAGRLTASDFGRILQSAAERDPKLALDLAETVAPGKSVDWLLGFAKAKPDFVVVEAGGAPLVRQAIERGSSDAVGLLKGAGYDAIDTGRDVLKLSGQGIRSKDARFDPAQASSKNIMAGIAGASLLPAWMLSRDTTSPQD
jgi:hypothetical protein